MKLQIRERLPWIELTELLIEIDNLTGFSQALISAADSETRTPELQRHLYSFLLVSKIWAVSVYIGLIATKSISI